MKHIYIFLVLLCSLFCFGQKENKISVLYGITSNVPAAEMQKIIEEQPIQYKYMLEHKKLMEDVEFLLEIDEDRSDFETVKKISIGENKNYYLEAMSGFRYYVDKNIYIEQKDLLGQTYLIEESGYYQEWDLINDKKEVLGYTCYKAILKNAPKDSQITAWYAPKLPYQFGPTGYHGLPGLILETIQNGKLVVFAKEINLKAEDVWVLKPTTGIKTTQEKFNAILGTAKEKMESYNKN